MENTRYYYGEEVKFNSYLIMPRALLTVEKYMEMSSNAKLLYILLLDRMKVSAKNDWVDKDGRVFLYYTLEEAAKSINVSVSKVLRVFKELEKYELIFRKRQGLCKPSMIYVLKAQECSNEEVQTCQIDNSEMVNETIQDLSDIPTNNNNINNNKKNNNNINQSMADWGLNSKNIFISLIKTKIDYESFSMTNNKRIVDEILELMAEIYELPVDYVKINGISIPKENVIERFRKIDDYDINHIIFTLENNRSDIKNMRSYLIALIFNSVTTADCSLTAKVSYDFSR